MNTSENDPINSESDPMEIFLMTQRFVKIGNSALAVDTDLPGAEAELDRLEAELDSAIAEGPVSPLHPDAIDDYLWATWALHVSWTELRKCSTATLSNRKRFQRISESP